MANLNRVLLIGNLTRVPEMRYTPKGTAVAEIDIAVNRVWKDENGEKKEECVFVSVTCWSKTAENADQYLTKGSPVFIEGRLTLDTWEDKNGGGKKSKLKVVAENVQFLSGKPKSEHVPSAGVATQIARQPVAPVIQNNEFGEPDDIPF